MTDNAAIIESGHQQANTTKKCGKCGTVKPVEEFNFQDRRRGTRVSWCKPCWNAYMKEYYQKNRDAIGRHAKEWVEANPERNAITKTKYFSRPDIRVREHARRIYRSYGISAEQYYDTLKEQGGVCAICGGVNGNGKRLHVDHNHATGQIRGLLCNKCNNAVGLLDEDPLKAQRLILYLEKFNEQ
jgi:hypothetical protein